MSEQGTQSNLRDNMRLGCSVRSAANKMLRPLHLAAAFKDAGYEIDGCNSSYHALAEGVHGVITYNSKRRFE